MYEQYAFQHVIFVIFRFQSW